MQHGQTLADDLKARLLELFDLGALGLPGNLATMKCQNEDLRSRERGLRLASQRPQSAEIVEQ